MEITKEELQALASFLDCHLVVTLDTTDELDREKVLKEGLEIFSSNHS